MFIAASIDCLVINWNFELYAFLTFWEHIWRNRSPRFTNARQDRDVGQYCIVDNLFSPEKIIWMKSIFHP